MKLRTKRYLLPVILLSYIWLIFYIGAEVLSIKLQWYALSYIYTVCAGGFYILWYTVSAYLDGGD